MRRSRCGRVRGTALFLLALSGFPAGTYAQDEKEAAVKDWITSQDYTFKAQTALPMSGHSLQLTTVYSLKVTKDTVEAHLPYFGRAYVAPMDPSKGGIRFTSKKFAYASDKRKNGGWKILIEPEDIRDTRQLLLSISASGYATLRVISENRQPISFYGYIVQR